MLWRKRITADPTVLLGKPVIKNTRIGVAFVLELLAKGWSTDEIVENYPGVTVDDIRACLCYAVETIDRKPWGSR